MKTENVRSCLKRINWGYILLFLIYFVLQFKSINQGYFDTDEFDVFAGGEAVWRGAWLYRDYLSQHMPFSYYISAVFWLFGAHSVLAQRIYFYAAFSAVWVYMVKRYSDIVSKKCLMVFPAVFIMLINCYDMGTSILSEHMNAVGIIFLLLEFRLFLKNEQKNISLSSSVIISASILLTFGTTFVSAFMLLALFLMVAYSEICIVRKSCLKGKELTVYLFNKYKKLVICCAAPWIVLLAVYIVAGVLDDFYYGAYYLNREIYSGYLGGYGNSIPEAVLGGASYLADFIVSALTNIFGSDFEIKNFVLFLALGTALVYAIFHIISHNKKEGVLWLLIIIESATRGVFNFHSTHFTAVIALLCSMCFFDLTQCESNVKSSNIIETLKYVILGTVSLVYVSGAGAFISISLSSQPSEMSVFMNAITDKNEGIWCCQLACNRAFIEAERYGYKAITVPWFWDAYGRQFLNEFGDQPPRVCIFNKDLEVWGHNVNDYAPELVEYVNSHYTEFSPLLYIRNDYYDEAVSKIKETGVMYISTESQSDPSLIEISLENADKDYSEVAFPVWSEENGPDDIIWYQAVKNEDNNWSCKIDPNAHLYSGNLTINAYGKTETDSEMEMLTERSVYVS